MEKKEKGRHCEEKPQRTKRNGRKRDKLLIILALVLVVLVAGGWFVYEQTLGSINRIDEDKIEYVDPDEQDKFDEIIDCIEYYVHIGEKDIPQALRHRKI